jgi:hypothetical protein
MYRNLTFRDPTRLSAFYRTFRNRRFSTSKSTTFFAKNVKSLHILEDASPRMKQLVAIGKGLRGLKSIAGWDNSWGCHILGFLAFDRPSLSVLRFSEVVNWCNDLLLWLDKGAWRDEQERRRRDVVEVDVVHGMLELEALAQAEDTHSSPVEFSQDPQELEDPFPFKELRRLSISGYAVREFRLDFTHRIFRDITHLDIYYCRKYDWSTLKAMKNLTHIALDFLTLVELSYIEMEQCMDETILYCQTLPYLKVVIFACVNRRSRDFDVMDDTQSPLNVLPEDWYNGSPLIPTLVDEHSLHYFTRLCLGMHDPRIVLGIVSECLQPSHLMMDNMVNFVWPRNSYDWDFTVSTEEHRESWDVAEEIIERRLKARNERRRNWGKPIIKWPCTLGSGDEDEDESVEGEFGFRDIVWQRWNQASAVQP